MRWTIVVSVLAFALVAPSLSNAKEFALSTSTFQLENVVLFELKK